MLQDFYGPKAKRTYGTYCERLRITAEIFCVLGNMHLWELVEEVRKPKSH